MTVSEIGMKDGSKLLENLARNVRPTQSHREIIMNSIKNVIDVLSFNDDDSTCIDGIRKAISKYSNYDLQFANGGDRNQKATPELDFCNANNIELLWGIGGEEKSNSSSWILRKWEEKK